jgi:concanavalin A-like lectin/glucanase superfamily protein
VVAIVAALTGACSSHVLVAVDPCPDGGVASAATGCTRLLEDLVGWWRLDESAGSTVARDWSGSDNNGTLVDLDPTTVWGPGRAANGLAVAAAGFANVISSASINSITDHVTIAGWGYLEGTIVDEYATIASREEAATIDQHYHIGFYRDGIPTTFIKTDLGTSIGRGPVRAPANTWVHLATTYDGGIVRFYVDGREVMNEGLTGRFASDTTPFVLGGNGNGAGDANVSERFAGRIDEIMLYRRALSAAEIAQLHDGALFVSP